MNINKIKEIKTMPQSEVKKKLNRIKKIFDNIPVFKGYEGYLYSNFTLTDFNPPMDPQLIENMADLIVYHGDFESADLILSEADRGAGPLTHAVALRCQLPYTLANWYPIQSVGSVKVQTAIGFSGEGYVCVFGLKKNQKIILVDDLISSGGTALGLIECVKKAGAIMLEALFVGNKINMGGSEKIQKKYHIPVKTLINFESLEDRTRVL
ncbi:hypothetical protein COY13_01235 [Candidatus Roizmanbacteria bacterium CG_4_10_14_0_2_um_filter_36_35]|uniref:Adenine phosphoribosyltransferase n=5 Tax=Candidatus Roizmaniibacteriota TaxID=1752723 RepID=A0A2M7BVK8_9BACT|nr:MAG: hypothetical protein COV86_01905 [Candidatus Roizmanbacteria bacterium CG11_big_fil_rev_8_21_14_0_20_35_14]PIV10613.1 MAG: hypothetical protein COS50_04540 [Candidatus Roizmanbacteria bacterium CG03_land_8_20_14_0_80_35_26]PIX71266.1 MAG: hypothetical protein COZ39_03835 [Candidatus Roizmanbacteria bacterium CG_4_10_14_3_um_filter_33_21]PIZ68455.1 MAG: hypothetical protein COY13_01235 [Candidatus Roizmanbacteria bacterium CG_4_10_14_0_2_um_filter_36_35]PJC32396.1 MAG: hypothetical prote